MVGGWFRVIFSVAKFIWVEVGVDGYSSSKRFGIETESWVEVFIKVYVTCYDKVLRLIRKACSGPGMRALMCVNTRSLQP